MSFDRATKEQMNLSAGKRIDAKRTCPVCYSGDPTQPRKCQYIACPGKRKLAMEKFQEDKS